MVCNHRKHDIHICTYFKFYIAKNDTFDNMEQKVQQIETPSEQPAFVAFDPFSAIVIKHLNDRKDLKSKIKLFCDILEDNRAETILETDTAKTVVFPGHKGSQHETWQGVIQMAKDINANGENVVFLPELKNGTSADALVMFRGKPVVADFKYCVTTNSNTLACDLSKGFHQAKTIVLKLENMDSGQLCESIDYLNRNGIERGNLILINKYGKLKYLSRSEIISAKYQKIVKGFL